NVMTGAAMDAAPTGAMLPALLPVLGSDAVVDDGDARSEELRGLLAAILRLENIVEEETAALTSGNRVDFDEFSAQEPRHAGIRPPDARPDASRQRSRGHHAGPAAAPEARAQPCRPRDAL